MGQLGADIDSGIKNNLHSIRPTRGQLAMCRPGQCAFHDRTTHPARGLSLNAAGVAHEFVAVAVPPPATSLASVSTQRRYCAAAAASR
jgi:hypothetical protein